MEKTNLPNKGKMGAIVIELGSLFRVEITNSPMYLKALFIILTAIFTGVVAGMGIYFLIIKGK